MGLDDLPVETVLHLLFGYTPCKAAAIAAVVLYALVTVAVAAVTLRTRTYYMLTVVITGILELIGWSTRLVMLSQPSTKIYAMHQALLIISPVLLAIVEYITLGKLLALGSSNSTGHARFASRVKWCFTISDIFCLLLQSTGGGLYAKAVDGSGVEMARTLLLAGLGAQLAFFSLFICLTTYVHNAKQYGFKHDKAFRPVFICLYATTLLMHLRNCFRVAEFAKGLHGHLAVTESFLYVFDFAPIYACFLLFTVMHYGFWLGPAAPAMIDRMERQRNQLPVDSIMLVQVQQAKARG